MAYNFFGVYIASHHDESSLSQRWNHAMIELIHFMRFAGSIIP